MSEPDPPAPPDAPAPQPPGADAPSPSTAGYDAPGHSAPSADAPSADAPSADAPSADAPSADAPAHSLPGADAPGHSTSGSDAPGHTMPAHEAPAHEAPAHDAPVYGTPSQGTPGYGVPGYGRPGQNPPGHGVAGYGAPGFGTPGRHTSGYGAPQQNTSGYGVVGYGAPAPMPAIDPRGFAPPRPITTTVAFWCWLAGAVLVVIGLPSLLYTGIDGIADEMLRDSLGANEPMTADEAQLTARITPVLVALGLAVAAVPFVVAAAKLRSGRNWARILLTVLAAPSALFGLFVLLAFTTDGLPYVPWVLGVAWSYLFIGVCALGFVAMYLPASNAYVRSVTG